MDRQWKRDIWSEYHFLGFGRVKHLGGTFEGQVVYFDVRVRVEVWVGVRVGVRVG